MIEKAIISGVLFSSIFLVGCNGEKEEASELVLTDNEQEVVVDDQGDAELLTELQNEIIAAITEKTEIDSESIAITLGGNVKEISVSVGFPKDVKVDDTMIQQIVEDSIKKVSEAENVTISEENITIKIEKY
ncbi:topoisomerase [Sporosarcina gallistercoris]|uniref:topoisomerase n=1 Tax=Sporosarcina gallistercoris TaxID=2762245 RepID=UPI003D2AD052